MSVPFRFEVILQLRRRQRDEAGAAVGQANEAIHRIDDQTEAIRAQRKSIREGASERRVGEVSVDALLTSGRYDLQLQAEIHALNDTRSDLLQELERRRLALVAAQAEVKKFERLEEKQRTAAYADMLRREQADADDATATRYTIERRR